LRNAMLSTMKKHYHPRDWAAFTLIGEAEWIRASETMCLRQEPYSYPPQFSLHPTPVLSCAKTSPPLTKGRGLRGGVKSTWNTGLNVIVHTNGKIPAISQLSPW
jgi:hypothetical protein